MYGNTHSAIGVPNVGNTVGLFPDDKAMVSHAFMYVEAVFCQVLSLSRAPLATSAYIELLEVVLLAEHSTDFCHGSYPEYSFQGQVRGVVGGTAVING